MKKVLNHHNALITKNIKHFMSLRKVTQVELAAGINMTQSGLSLMFAKHEYKTSNLLKIAEFLNISPGKFFDDENQQIISEPVVKYANNEIIDQLKRERDQAIKERDTAQKQYLFMIGTINYLINYIKDEYGIDLQQGDEKN